MSSLVRTGVALQTVATSCLFNEMGSAKYVNRGHWRSTGGSKRRDREVVCDKIAYRATGAASGIREPKTMAVAWPNGTSSCRGRPQEQVCASKSTAYLPVLAFESENRV